jgi:transcriptional regulator with XRE-family HTH domain
MNEKERIEYIINHYGLSPSSFADHLGINRSSISHILSERNKPSMDIFIKIANAYKELSTDWLFLGVGDVFKANNKSYSKTNIIDDELTHTKINQADYLFNPEIKSFDRNIIEHSYENMESKKMENKKQIGVIILYNDKTSEFYPSI